MAYQIIEEHEPLPVHDPIIVLYGAPGSGKTSLAYTADTPMLLDFDEGSNRAVGRKRSVRFKRWDDMLEFMEAGGPLETMQSGTLIVDTAGAMLDELVADFVIKQNSRYGKPGGGLGLQGFGAMKEVFAAFMRKCKSLKVLPLFICHVVEKQDGDDMRLRPKLTGGAYDILISKADLVGYVEMKDGQAVINFNPTSRHIGKNCVEFPLMKVPHYASPEYVGFMQRIIDRTRDRMAAMNDAQRAALETVKSIQDAILNATDFPSLVETLDEVEKLSPIYHAQVLPDYQKRFCSIWKEHNTDKAHSVDDFTDLIVKANELDATLQRMVKKDIVASASHLGFVWDRDLRRFKADMATLLPEHEADASEEETEGPSLEEVLAAQAGTAPVQPVQVPATTPMPTMAIPIPPKSAIGKQGTLLQSPAKATPTQAPV